MAIIGRVVAMTGTAFVLTDNGAKRELHLGDQVQTGETIQTASGVEVDLELTNGRVVHVGADQLVAFTPELAEAIVPSALDSAINLATIETVIKAIESGKDINEALEETAAGANGLFNVYGFGFVDLVRIDDVLNKFKFAYEYSADDRVASVPLVVIDDVSQLGDVAISASASSVKLSATPTLTEAGGNIVYTATITQAPVTDLSVTLSNGELITILAGQFSGTTTIVVLASDDVYIDPAIISSSITGTSGGGIIVSIDPTAAITNIIDTVDVATVSLSADASVIEGGIVTYTATLTNPAQGAVTVTLSNGAIITIANGATLGTISFAAPSDDIYVDAGSVSATISNATGGNFEQLNINPVAAVTIITDSIDATTVTLTASAASVVEGATVTYTVSVNNPVTGTPLNVTLNNGQIITIPVGASSATGAAIVLRPDDAFVQGTTTTTASIASTTGGNFEALTTTSTAATTVTDDADATTVSIAGSANVTEGFAGGYILTLTNIAQSNVTVNLSYSGTAINGTDYSGFVSVTILAGQTTANFNISTIDDILDEALESFTVTINSVTGGNFESLGINATNNSVTTTITDNDLTPTLSIGDVTVVENVVGGFATFTVTLSAVSGQTVTVGYNTSNGTATSVTDYSSSIGTITFLPGQISRTITVPIVNDTSDEPNETFYVNLLTPINATISDNLGVGSITDDDLAPTITSVSSESQLEGTSLVHTVILSNPSSLPTTFAFSLGGGTATSALDYSVGTTFSNGVTLSNGLLTVPAGVSNFMVTVPTILDAIDEGASEIYNLAIGGIVGTGSIIDDDDAPTLAVSDISVAEVDNLNAVFVVSLSNPSASAVTVNLGFANDTATGGTSTSGTSSTDYGNNSRMQVSTDGGVTWSANGTNVVTFVAGQTQVFVRTYINANTGGTELPIETFTLTATTSAGTTLNSSATGTASIIDETITVSNSTVTEGGTLSFAVNISAHASVVVTSLTLSGTASALDYGSLTFTNGVTYDAGTGLLSIPGGITAFTVSLPTINDTLDEPNESVFLNIGGVTGIGTINDNDATPTLSIFDVTVNEGAGTATFTVALSAASGQTVSVDYSTISGTALIGVDFTNTFGTLNFAPGITSQIITVPIINDNVFEGSETFRVNLTSPVNATISDNLGIGTIVDNGTGFGGTDNDTPTFTVNSVTVSDQASTFAIFQVSLSNPSATATTFSLTLANGTATGAGTDYGTVLPATNLQISTDNGVTWTSAVSVTIASGSTVVLVRTPITADIVNEVSESFTLTATRTAGTTTNTTVVATGTITDVNNAPEAINDVPASSLQEDLTTILSGNAILGGSGNFADADPNNDTLSITGIVAGAGAVTGVTTLSAPETVSGIYGALQMQANGSYTYTLDNSRIQTQNILGGQTVSDVFTYKITDGNGGFDTATISVSILGSIDLFAITPQPVLISSDGLSGEYYGYNDSSDTGNLKSIRIHADDNMATALGTDDNLNSVEDLELIINGRNVAVGGPDNVVGTAIAGAVNAADVKFFVRNLDYGLTPQVDGDLGANSALAAGSALLPGDNNNLSATRSLSNFLDQDIATAVVQTGAPTAGGVVGVNTGLGQTTDAIIRMTGSVYLERGNYDFRVFADDGFRLKVGGETLIEFDGNQAPTTRVFNNVEVSDLISGLTSIELLYWEQGGNAVLQFEFKPSSSAVWVPFSLDSVAFFSPGNAPVLTDTRIQDIVETSVNQQYQLRTGSVLDGDAAGNTLFGAAGRDYVQGFGGNDTLNGFGGADFLDGGDGNDTLNGGDGNDILIGGTGNDIMNGGLGDDIYRIDSALDTMAELAGEGTDTVEIDATYNPGIYTIAANFENVLLQGNFNANVIGNASANRITGNDGDNSLSGLAGDDRLIGGKGNDTLTGGTNNDIFEWNLADKGTLGSPAIDTVTDFVYSGGKTDSLDLRDLLVGEASTELNTGATPNIGNLLNYIDINFNAGTGNTELRISSTGGFTSGTYAPGAEDQRIVLAGVNLYTATGAAAGNETDLLQRLLANGTLVVD